MRKLGVFVVIFLLMGAFGLVGAEEAEITFDFSGFGNVSEEFVDSVGDVLLKFQEFFMGVVSFVSLGFAGDSEGNGFASVVVFLILLFMLVYMGLSFTPFFSGIINFFIALVITAITFLTIDLATIRTIFLAYGVGGAPGVGVSGPLPLWTFLVNVALPVAVILAFTFRIYSKAYAGEGDTSPFYANIINFVILLMFGVFFIRYSGGEVDPLKWMHRWTGWGMVIFSVLQGISYRVIAGLTSAGGGFLGIKLWTKLKDVRKEVKKNREAAATEADKLKATDLADDSKPMSFDYSKGMRRGASARGGKTSHKVFSYGSRKGLSAGEIAGRTEPVTTGKVNEGSFVKKKSVEIYMARYGAKKAKKRFG